MFKAMTLPVYNALADYPLVTYGLAASPYGPMAVAWWPDAKAGELVCYLALTDNAFKVADQLQAMFPRNTFKRDDKKAVQFAKTYKPHTPGTLPSVLMKGTPFFLKIWETLYKTKTGQTMSYGALATKAGRPLASRAVGQAMATNPIALIVPCHRVLHSTGGLGGYAYGLDLKKRLLADEQL